MSSTVVEKLQYTFPNAIPSENFQPSYITIDPTNTTSNSEGYYKSGDKIDIDLSAEDNMLLDSENSYVQCRGYVYSEYANLASAPQTDIPILGFGLPLSRCEESVNNGTIPISNYSNNFHRYSTGRLLCSDKYLEDTAVNRPNTLNDKRAIVGVSGVNGVDLNGLAVAVLSTNTVFIIDGVSYPVSKPVLMNIEEAVTANPVLALGVGSVITIHGKDYTLDNNDVVGVESKNTAGTVKGVSSVLGSTTTLSYIAPMKDIHVWDASYARLHGYEGCGVVSSYERLCSGTFLDKNTGVQRNDYGGFNFSIPLRVFSNLASSHQYIPIQYFAQSGTSGLRIRTFVQEASKCSITMNRNTSIAPPTKSEVRLFDVKLFCKYVKVSDPVIQSILFSKFIQESEIVDVPTPSGGMQQVSIPKKLLMPFMKYEPFEETLSAGRTQYKLNLAVSERSLQGIMIRFNSTSFSANKYNEKMIGDHPIKKIRNIQIKIGNSIILPTSQINNSEGAVGNALNSYLADWYNAGRHIFDPNLNYNGSNSGALTRLHWNRYSNYESLADSSFQYGFPHVIIIPLENFNLTSLEAGSGQMHSKGIDTNLHSNRVDILLDFVDSTGEDIFCEILMASRHVIQCGKSNIGDVTESYL